MRGRLLLKKGLKTGVIRDELEANTRQIWSPGREGKLGSKRLGVARIITILSTLELAREKTNWP